MRDEKDGSRKKRIGGLRKKKKRKKGKTTTQKTDLGKRPKVKR